VAKLVSGSDCTNGDVYGRANHAPYCQASRADDDAGQRCHTDLLVTTRRPARSAQHVTMKTGNLSCTVKASWLNYVLFGRDLTQTVSATTVVNNHNHHRHGSENEPAEVTVSFA